MIEARKANTIEEIKVVLKAMNKEGLSPFLFSLVYGYWENDICLGGTLLDKECPRNFDIALTNIKSISIAKAFANVLREAFKIQTSIVARIDNFNFKSLKLCKCIGFKKVYEEDNTIIMEIRKEYWRYNKRWPI